MRVIRVPILSGLIIFRGSAVVVVGRRYLVGEGVWRLRDQVPRVAARGHQAQLNFGRGLRRLQWGVGDARARRQQRCGDEE